MRLRLLQEMAGNCWRLHRTLSVAGGCTPVMTPLTPPLKRKR